MLNFVVSYCQVWKRKSFGAPHISYSRETIGFSDVSRISNSPRPPKFSVAVFLSAARKIQNASISSPLLQSNLFSIIIILSDVRAQSALLVHDGSASKSYFLCFQNSSPPSGSSATPGISTNGSLAAFTRIQYTHGRDRHRFRLCIISHCHYIPSSRDVINPRSPLVGHVVVRHDVSRCFAKLAHVLVFSLVLSAWKRQFRHFIKLFLGFFGDCDGFVSSVSQKVAYSTYNCV